MIKFSKITDYQVVSHEMYSASGTLSFNVKVQEEIERGWQPYGPLISHEIQGGKVMLSQAMVKGFTS